MKNYIYMTAVLFVTIGHASESTLGKSAKEIFATYYQSCEALDAPILDDQDYDHYKVIVQRKKVGSAYKRYLKRSRVEDYHNNNPVFNYISADGQNSCLDSFTQPPVYAYGGTAKYSNNTLDFLKDLTREKECQYSPGNGTICRSSSSQRNTYSQLSGIDCSAYVSAAFAISGYKFKTSQSSRYLRYTTTNIHSVVHAGRTSCLAAPKLNVDNPLEVGDILNVKGSHVVLVDELGSDPLGIKMAKTIQECDDITSDDFTFAIIQSASAHSIGLQRSFASAYFKRSGNYFRTNMELVASKVCKAKFQQKDFWQMSNSSSNKFSLTRMDVKKSGCLGKPVKIVQRECFNECL